MVLDRQVARTRVVTVAFISILRYKYIYPEVQIYLSRSTNILIPRYKYNYHEVQIYLYRGTNMFGLRYKYIYPTVQTLCSYKEDTLYMENHFETKTTLSTSSSPSSSAWWSAIGATEGSIPTSSDPVS